MTAGYIDDEKMVKYFSIFGMNGLGYKLSIKGDCTDDELKELDAIQRTLDYFKWNII
ncbi:MAG: hypothetical protein J6F30_13390 [Cellulosilyticum sp.]|nr:hypothetical protein [Cellulosilyticum sp.]